MQYHDTPYLTLLSDVCHNGHLKQDRTGTGTRSVFSRMLRFDLSDGTIPLLTTKKMHTKSIIHELLWFLAGDTNIKYLNDNGVRIWDEWADEKGDLGPVYGAMWRRWPVAGGAAIDYQTDPSSAYIKYKYIDQIAEAINLIKHNPNSRRIIVNSWNPELLPDSGQSFSDNVANGKQALPPCHYVFQLYVNDGKLSCQLNMRSSDVFLGLPFNIAQYSILLRMLAQVTGLEAAEFVYVGTDVHLYNNHVDVANTQLSREPFPSPTLEINPDVRDIDSFKFDDFRLVGYQSHPILRAPVAI